MSATSIRAACSCRRRICPHASPSTAATTSRCSASPCTVEQLDGLPSFPAADKKKDPRYKWFVANHGRHCWELDAMDPNDLRDCVEQEIIELIEPVAWQRCEVVNKAEQESLQTVLEQWGGAS